MNHQTYTVVYFNYNFILSLLMMMSDFKNIFILLYVYFYQLGLLTTNLLVKY